MSDLRSKFEKLPEVEELLSKVVFSEERGMYDAKNAHYEDEEQDAIFVNGAWYAYKEKHSELLEKQQKIDTALNLLCKLQYSSGERIYKEVSEVLNACE